MEKLDRKSIEPIKANTNQVWYTHQWNVTDCDSKSSHLKCNQYKEVRYNNDKFLTNLFCADASEPKPSEPNISRDFEEPPLWDKVGTDITSPGVWVEGVEGELGDGPVVLTVPELLAGPEDDTGCFLFRPIWFFEALNQENKMRKATRI